MLGCSQADSLDLWSYTLCINQITPRSAIHRLEGGDEREAEYVVGVVC